MRQFLYPLMICGLLTTSHSLFAQDSLATKNSPKQNIFKVNVSALAFKNASVQYERALSKKISLGLGFSLMPKVGLPFASSLKGQFGDNADVKRAIESTQLSNFAITPEVRFYLGKKGALTGFYLAPFARYQQMNFEQVYEYTASNGKKHTPLIGGKINNIGGGLLVGAQWNLSKSLTLDWWIAGPLMGTSKGSLSGTDDMSDLSATDRANLENNIESVKIPLTKIDATVGNNRIDVNLSGTYAGVRAFGLALGFRF